MPGRGHVTRVRRLGHPSAVLFACLFASQSALLVLSPILVDVAREFGVSAAAAGQLRSISGATGGVAALVVATAPRRPGLRALLSLGTALVVAGSLLSAAAPSFFVLAAAQTVLGVGVGLLVAVGIAAAGEWPTPANRPHVLAWTIVGMPAAWIVGMPVIGAVAEHGWRWAFVAVPAVAGLVALALVRLRPPEASSRRTGEAVSAWRRPDVARFAFGELLANAAWAAVLTYSGALLRESYSISSTIVALSLALMATAMLPGAFGARRRAAHPTRGLLAGVTAFQGAAVLALGAVRIDVPVTIAVLATMAFVNGRRTMVASALGMDTASEDRVAVMSLRAAANQFGYLLGAAAGGLALALGGFSLLGITLAALFLIAALIHVPPPIGTPTAVPQKA
jgi:MFS transporter, DHA1 family, inner membrane transport protein